MERRRILFSGRVQGVGFRMTSVQLAEGLSLSGTVRNLDDGRVELIVDGDTPVIEALITRLREHFGTLIRSMEQATASRPASVVPVQGIRVVH